MKDRTQQLKDRIASLEDENNALEKENKELLAELKAKPVIDEDKLTILLCNECDVCDNNFSKNLSNCYMVDRMVKAIIQEDIYR